MSDVYKIGVAIMLSDGMSPVLSMISRKLLGIHKSVKEIETGFGRWKFAIGGAASVFAGSALLGGMAKLVNHAKEYQHELAKARALGLSDAQMKQVDSKAWDNARGVRGTDVAHNVNTIGSLYSIVGLDEALKLSTKFEQADRVLASVGKGQEGSAYILARAGELMGKFTDPKSGHLDVALFGNFLDTIVKSVIATHGKVGASEWLNYAKQAGPAAGNLDNDGMLTTTAIIQAMGGNRAGTAAAALNRQFAGGIMAQRVAKELERVGIAEKGDFKVARGGQIIAKTGAMKDLIERLQHDPLDAMLTKVLPALEHAGYNTNEKLSAELYRIIGTGPAQRAAYELIRGRYQIASERERAKGGMGVDAANANRRTDPLEAEKAVHASWSNMLTAMTSGPLLAAIPIMDKLTDVFNKMGALANAHPEAMLVIAQGITALGVALTVAGGAALLAALGPVGWIAGGIVALGAALTAFNPDALKIIGTTLLIIGRGAAACVAPLQWLAGVIAKLVGAVSGMTGGGKAIEKGFGVPGAEMPSYDPTTPGKQGYNAVPPAGGRGGPGGNGDIYMDGRKVGEIVSKHQSLAANGPLSGSAYFDGSAAFVPSDYSFARG